MNSFKSKTKKSKKQKNTTAMIDQAGCSHKIEKCDGFSFISVLSKCLFFVCLFFYISFFCWHNLNAGKRLQPPIRVEYKLYQSAAATAASDKSLSDTLMPSNCLWRPLPVCCLSQTPTPPHPASPDQHCPSTPATLPVLITAWSFYPTCHLSSPAGLVWTPHTSKTSHTDCATGVSSSSRRVFQ